MDSNNDTTIAPAKPDFDKFIAMAKDLWDNCPMIGYELHEHIDPMWWRDDCRGNHATLSERVNIFRDALRRLNWIIADIQNNVHVRDNV